LEEENTVRTRLLIVLAFASLLSSWNTASAQIASAPPTADVKGQDNPQIDGEGLQKILAGLGYEPKQIKAGESVALQIELEHADGKPRRHLIGFDPKAATIFIIGGGFAHSPDPKKASNAWFRKLLKANHRLAPSYIFLNDFDVFGLTTIMGNVNITPAQMKTKLKEHVTNFDKELVPLVKELPSIEKAADPDKTNDKNADGVER